MKVLFLSSMSGYPWGGSEELWSQAALALAPRAGFDVVASTKLWPTEHARLSRLRDAGVATNFWTDRRSWTSRLVHKIVPRNQHLETIRSVAPDIIINSNGWNAPGVEVARALLSSCKPYVTICQANHAEWFFPDEVRDVYADFYGAARANIFVAKDNLRFLEAQLGCRVPRSCVVRNPLGQSVKSLSRQELPFAWDGGDGPIRLASVARLHPPSKGQDILLEVLAAPKWIGRDWRLDVYGQGPYSSTVRQLIQMHGLEARVSLKGHTDDVADVWRTHDLLLLSSRYEGLPLSLVEAMMCGRPAVATDVGDIRELLKDGETGFLAPAPTAALFDSAMERMWEQRGSLHALGAKAHQLARDWIAEDPGEALSGLIERELAAC